jgi:hypothetical protein
VEVEKQTMDAITYSLRADQPRSDQFYRDIAAFTDEVLAKADHDLGAITGAFAASAHDDGRTAGEYSFELLTLGVLWREYAHRALKLARPSQRVLSALATLREHSGPAKPAVDALRGALATAFLARNGHAAPVPEPPAVAHLGRLVDWLAATGDFEQEVARLRVWLAFFDAQPPEQTESQIAAILTLADWFAARSLDALGQYTPHVERFLRETHPSYRWREDVIFCGRARVEYHLNMVGTEIMNRAFRAAFLATPQKVVLVPPCMRAKTADECQARETPFGQQCAGCEPRCHVHQVTQLGKKRGFAVYIMPRELTSFSPGEGAQAAMTGLGIVGVSCPLTNAQGGWKAKKLHIPAQGLLLDYCGCVWHWHLDGGIPTAINLRQLMRLLEPESVPETSLPHPEIPSPCDG